MPSSTKTKTSGDNSPTATARKDRKPSERNARKEVTQNTMTDNDLKSSMKRFQSEQQIRTRFEALVNRLTSVKLMKNGDISPTHLTFEELTELCLRVREQFLLEPVLIRTNPPLCVFGDIHGQYADLLAMLRQTNFPPKQKLVFLGDYVDRGNFSLETIALLLSWKLLYPARIFLLRGNHETRAVCRQYGFLEECRRRFGDETGSKLWTSMQHVFNCMPLAGIVGSRIFCAHGGISEDMLCWGQLERVTRPFDIVDLGLLADLLWSDPSCATKKFDLSPRGVSMIFGSQAINEFCARLKVDLIVRGHQCVTEGYEIFSDNKRCITVFSAPAYCGELENFAAVLHVSSGLECTIFQYKSTIRYNDNEPSLMTPIDSNASHKDKDKDKEADKDKK